VLNVNCSYLSLHTGMATEFIANIFLKKLQGMEQVFTVLENKTIGRNLYKFRKVKEKKAAEVADYIGLTEAAYTKYERGESQITIDIIQKVAECLKIDPISIIANTPGNFVENLNSPNSIVAGNTSSVGGDANYTDEKQTTLITKLIEAQIALTEKVMVLLEKR